MGIGFLIAFIIICLVIYILYKKEVFWHISQRIKKSEEEREIQEFDNWLLKNKPLLDNYVKELYLPTEKFLLQFNYYSLVSLGRNIDGFFNYIIYKANESEQSLLLENCAKKDNLGQSCYTDATDDFIRFWNIIKNQLKGVPLNYLSSVTYYVLRTILIKYASKKWTELCDMTTVEEVGKSLSRKHIKEDALVYFTCFILEKNGFKGGFVQTRDLVEKSVLSNYEKHKQNSIKQKVFKDVGTIDFNNNEINVSAIVPHKTFGNIEISNQPRDNEIKAFKEWFVDNLNEIQKHIKETSSAMDKFLSKINDWQRSFIYGMNGIDKFLGAVLGEVDRKDSSSLLRTIALDDGIEMIKNQSLNEVILIFVRFWNIIANRLQCVPQKYISSVTYYIIRATAIKSLSAKWKQQFNIETIEEYGANLDQFAGAKSQYYLVCFTCFVMESKDLKPNFIATKDFIEKVVPVFYEKSKQKALEDEMFSNVVFIKNEDQGSTEETEIVAIEDVDTMDGRQFEIFIAEHFKKKGFDVTLTQTSGDFGVDVIIDNGLSKIGIQAKCYNGHNVDNHAVQEAVAGRDYYGLDKAMVVTNSYYTAAAIKLAKTTGVLLWNRDDVIKMLRED